MIVVADTSVILNLCRVQHEHLLQELYHHILVPSLVSSEFTRLAGTQSRFAGLSFPAWINVLPDPQTLPSSIAQENLDAGESVAIALCLNEKADALLIDETLGRLVAQKLGIRTIGLLGVLIQSRQRQLISSVKIVMDRLEKEAGFWLSPGLRARVLHAVGE